MFIINTIAADDQIPGLAKSSVVMVFATYRGYMLVFYEHEF